MASRDALWSASGSNVQRHEPPVPHAVLGVMLFVICEMLFFAGLMAAYLVGASANPGAWPPPGETRLPVEVSAVNTLVLLASGAVLWRAGRVFAKDGAKAGKALLTAIALGLVFLGVQGTEWVALLRDGFTLHYSTHASFFYLLVGVHALHVLLALGLLLLVYQALRRNALTPENLWAAQIFWYFVVGVWPVLYGLVYFS